MAAPSEAEIAAQLIERLLADQAFRVRFRRDPAAACREAGLEQLAQEMTLGAGKAMMTLDVRESKSSLAGVMMAAAMEGVGLYQFSQNVLPHLEDAPPAVGDVLSRVNLPSVQGELAGSPPASDAAALAAAGAGADGAASAAGGGAATDGAASSGAASGTGAADAAASNAASDAASNAGAADAAASKPAASKGAASDEALPPEQAAARKIAAAESPEAKRKQAAEEAAAKIAAEADDLPDANDFPDGPVQPQAAVDIGADGKPVPAASNAAPAAPSAAATAPAAPPEVAAAAPAAAPPESAAASAPAGPSDAAADVAGSAPGGSSGAVDPGQFGAEGSGGPPSAETSALLKNPNVAFDETGIADLKAGRIDPRVVAVLGKLSQDHKITVSCMCSDHSKFTSGGSVSNHHYGRGVDIAAIDGVPVNTSNFDAREIAMELQDFDPSIRPNEIGTPWAIAGPGYFTDAGHHDHLHIGFKEQISPDWKPPAELAAQPAGTAAPAVGAPPAAAAPAAAPAVGVPAAAGSGAPPVPERKPGDSLAFAAVTPQAQAAAAGAAAKPGDSLAFLPKVEPQPAQAAAAPPEALAAAASGPVAGPDAYPGDDAPREQLAAWMAKQAEKRGLPPELPVMAALVESNLQNLNFGDADSVGFFQMRVSIWNQGDYAGYPDDPQKQVDWFLDTAERVMAQRKAAGLPTDDPNQFGEWIADVERPAEQYRGRYQLKLAEAQDLLKNAQQAAPAPPATPDAAVAGAVPDAGAVAPGGGGGSPLGAAALRVAQTQRGVREIGSSNTGPQVDEYLDAAGVAPGNPWCASFITWSLQQAGHKMPGGGWAAVSTWVRNAEQGANGLNIVSADEARPGDIVAYDWGGQDDFAGDGHIGFLDSTVQGGRFTALEGNNADAVNHVPRSLDDANVVFIRVEGNAAEGAAAAGTPAAAAPAPAAAAPSAPDAGVPPVPERKPGDSLAFEAVTPRQAQAAAAGSAQPKPGDSLSFLPKVEPQPAAAQAAAAPPEQALAAAASGPVTGPDAYPGDDAPREQLAAWMAKQAEKRGIPPELPVMAALVESNLQNLNYGDADSFGFFQMRVSIWNRDYPGFADDPQKQIDWFLDTAKRVMAQRKAAGQPIDDPNKFGEWIADVERPAEQYRGRYQLKLAEAQDLLKNAEQTAPAPGAAAQPAAPTPEAAAEAVAGAAPTGGAGPKALAALAAAKKYLGTPYQWGGSTPETNFDCSGLVQWSYAQAGIQIPRVTYDQIDAPNATPVGRNDLVPGDLVFFANAGDVHHVGMFIGGDKFIHAPHTGDVVKISSLNETYYAEQFAGGRRFDAATGAPAPAQPAAAAPAPAAAPPPAVDPTEVAKAQAAVARDAAEVRRNDSLLFAAVQAQEAAKHRATVQFLKAIDPAEAKAAAPATPAPAAPAPAPASPPEAAAPAPAAVPPEVAAGTAPADGSSTPAPGAGPPPDLSGIDAAYPGDDASQAELAKWLAKQAEKKGLPPELPVMAALVESGVKNLNFGDADSVGFFQMRVGIWNKGEYAGYPERPDLQAKWFIDHALAVKKQRIAAGDVDFGKDPSKFGEWIADVERPAAQYRGRYQLRLDEARRLLA